MVDFTNFSFCRRNYGHWDVTIREGRIFAIRGGPGKYYVRDTRPNREYSVREGFKTLSAAMQYVTDELTHELIVAEGQEVHTIESWNV